MISNVYQRKDGRYEGRVTVGRIEGKRQYKAFFGRTADEVMRRMSDFRENSLSTATVRTVKITFAAVYDEWISSISYRVKESTLANYTLKADKHLLPVYGNKNITAIE